MEKKKENTTNDFINYVIATYIGINLIYYIFMKYYDLEFYEVKSLLNSNKQFEKLNEVD